MATTVKANQFLVDKRGRPRAVVLSIVSYQKLLRLVEDATDSLALKQAIRTRRGTLTHTDLLTRLNEMEV